MEARCIESRCRIAGFGFERGDAMCIRIARTVGRWVANALQKSWTFITAMMVPPHKKEFQ